LVARTAVGVSRRAGLAAALAMGVGAALWAAAALIGLAVIFAQFDWLYIAAKIAGGVFLIWIAAWIWRGARLPLPEEGAAAPEYSLNRAFRSALWVQLSNPKVAVFFGSIFIALLPQGLPLWLKGLVLAIVFVDEFLWYAVVALLLSAPRPRRAYARSKVWLDRITAGFLCVIGLRLVLDRS